MKWQTRNYAPVSKFWFESIFSCTFLTVFFFFSFFVVFVASLRWNSNSCARKKKRAKFKQSMKIAFDRFAKVLPIRYHLFTIQLPIMQSHQCKYWCVHKSLAHAWRTLKMHATKKNDTLALQLPHSVYARNNWLRSNLIITRNQSGNLHVFSIIQLRLCLQN